MRVHPFIIASQVSGNSGSPQVPLLGLKPQALRRRPFGAFHVALAPDTLGELDSFMNFDKWLGREYRGVTVQQKRRSIRFRAPGQADKSAWTVFQVEGSDCLLFVHPEAQRRRLTPVPSGWQQFGEAELADLLNRATPAPVSLMTRIRKRTVKPSALPVQQRHDELLALEHEQRLTTEQLLDEAHAALKGMEGDLQSAHAELRVMDEELQEMAETIRKLTRTPSLEPAPEPRTQKEAGRIASPSKGRRSRPETHQRST